LLRGARAGLLVLPRRRLLAGAVLAMRLSTVFLLAWGRQPAPALVDRAVLAVLTALLVVAAVVGGIVLVGAL
jgi:hypothetical protein